MRVRDKLSRATARGADPDPASEGAEAGEVLFLSSSENQRGVCLISHRDCIGYAEHMIEGVWPKLDIEVSTNKQGTDSATNGAMSTFNLTILMRGISSSRMDGVAEL